MDIPARIQLEVGERWSARLPGLGSAGYQWTYDVEGDTGMVEVSLTSLPPPCRPAAGEPPDNASADTLVEVRAVRPGAVTLELIQRRSWERDRPPLERRLVEVTVVA